MTGISISIASDTKQFTSGVKSGVLEPLDDVQDSLKKVGETGERAGDDLVRALKEDQRQTEANAKAYRDMSDTIHRTTKSSTSDFELDTREKKRLSREAIKEVGEEAKQNAAETFSSFDGSAQSFVDGVQGTLGGLVSSMGPVGIAIGTAGALAIGIVNGALQKADTDSQEFKQHVADLATQFLTSGEEGHRAFSDIATDVQGLATNTDKSKTSLSDLKEIAKTLGVPLRNVVDAYEKGGKPLDDLLGKQKQLQKAENDRYRDLVKNDPNKVYDGLNPKVSNYAGQLDKVNTVLGAQKEALKEATNAADIAAKAGLSDYQIKADLLDDIASGYDSVRSSASDAATAEDGAFDVGKYLANVDAGKQALEQFKANLAQIKLTPDEWKNFLGLDEKTQQQLASAYTSGDSALQQRIRDSLSDAGDKAGKDATVKFSDSFKPEQKDDLKIKVDDSDAKAKVDDLTKKKTLTVDVNLANGAAAGVRNDLQRYLDTHPVNVNAKAGRYTP